MLPYLTQGLILGGTAAVQPGPLLALLLTLVAQSGWRRALPATLAPLLSDVPIVALVLVILTQVPERVLSLLQVVGGFFLLYLAWGAWKSFRRTVDLAEIPGATDESGTASGLTKAALTNALSPNPYLFWATIAGPIFLSGWNQTPANGIAFLLGFYLALVGGFALFVLLFATAGRIEPCLNRAFIGVSAAALALFALYQLVGGLPTLLSA